MLATQVSLRRSSEEICVCTKLEGAGDQFCFILDGWKTDYYDLSQFQRIVKSDIGNTEWLFAPA